MSRTRSAKKPQPLDARDEVETAVSRVGSKADREYWREMLLDLVRNNAVPAALLRDVPLKAAEAGRTRFDQVYAACMALALPDYREDTVRALLGPSADFSGGVRIWRAVFPEKFGLAHVLIRAGSFQQAFAYACDYACRASLRIFRKIPADLTVRVMFMSEKALRRHLDLRWANRVHKRKQLQLGAREFTPRQINGARLFALGKRGTDRYSVAKYSEAQDLRRIREKLGMARRSSVEHESHRR